MARNRTGQLPLGPRDLFDHRVVIGQPQPAPVLQLQRQAKPFGGRGGQHDQRIAVLAVPVRLRRAEPGFLQCPLHQPGIVVAGHSSSTPPRRYTVPSPSSTPSGLLGNRGSAACPAAFLSAGRRGIDGDLLLGVADGLVPAVAGRELAQAPTGLILPT